MERSPGASPPALRRAFAAVARDRAVPAHGASALAVFLIVRNLAGGGAPTPAPATVDANHGQVLAANIAFFEDRVAETKDNLSYNRLTGLYLQRAARNRRRRRRPARRAERQEVARSSPQRLRRADQPRPRQHRRARLRNRRHPRPPGDAVIPTRADALAILGDAQMALGQYDAATENYRLYLEKEPGFSAYSREATLAEMHGNVPSPSSSGRPRSTPTNTSPPRTRPGRASSSARSTSTTAASMTRRRSSSSRSPVYPNYVYAEAGLGQVAAREGDQTTAIDHYAKHVTPCHSPSSWRARRPLRRAGRRRGREAVRAHGRNRPALRRQRHQERPHPDPLRPRPRRRHPGDSGPRANAYAAAPVASPPPTSTPGRSTAPAASTKPRAKADEASAPGTKDPLSTSTLA